MEIERLHCRILYIVRQYIYIISPKVYKIFPFRLHKISKNYAINALIYCIEWLKENDLTFFLAAYEVEKV